MGKMTIYVRDEDEVLFDRAKALEDEGSLSQVLARALKDFLDKREAEDQGMRLVTLKVGEIGLEHKIGFTGKVLAQWPNQDNEWIDDVPVENVLDPDADCWRAFRTRKGKLLVCRTRQVNDWIFDYWVFDTYRDFCEELRDKVIEPFFVDLINALGEIEYLDI